MVTLLLPLLLSTEPPRYLGGAEPTPMTEAAPSDPAPSIQACTVETLRLSIECFFDATPIKPESEAAKKKQAHVNIDLAAGLATGACQRRPMPTGIDSKEKSAFISACTSRVVKALDACSLDGAEALLDAEGRFSKNAKRCYGEIAAALQSGDVPAQPRSEPTPTGRSPGAKPIKI